MTPSMIGPYELRGELGRGGMGVVYRARRADAGQDVALKVIAAGAEASPEQLARFQREARLAAELDHPAIVKVLETGFDDEPRLGAEAAGEAGRRRLWFAMELVEGEPLSAQIASREFTWQEAVTAVRDIADALSAAHAKGVLHRDLKPGNILVDSEGKLHLTDFGLAKDLRTGSKYTRTGETLGTPSYMSPEQARGDLAQLTPASDVWALGCILYELLANRRAFDGDTPAAIVGAVLTTEPGRPPGLPGPVWELCEALLQRRPTARPPDAQAVAEECERVVAGGRPKHRVRSATPKFAAAALLLLGAAAIATGLAWRRAREQERVARISAAAERAWDARHADPNAARRGLEQALAELPERDDWRIRLGLLRWAAYDLDGANAAWHGVTLDSPASRTARFYEGLARYLSLVERSDKSREPFDALAQDMRAVAAGGQDRIGTLASALIPAGEGTRQVALDLLAEVEGWEAALLRGQLELHREGGDPQLALREFDTALAHGLRFPWIVLNRAVAVEKTGDLEGALAGYREAIAARDPYPIAHANCARVHRLLGQWAEAEASATRCLEQDGPVFALAVRGRARTKSGRAREGIPDLEAYLRESPDEPTVLLWLAQAQFHVGDYEASARAAERALAEQPDFFDVRLVLIESTLKLGRIDAAVKMFAALSPDQQRATPALRVRASLEIQSRNPAAAVRTLEILTQRSPDDVQAWVQRGVALDYLGKGKEALASIDHALQLDPHDGHAHRARAIVLVTARRYDLALQSADVAAKALPGDGTSHALRATVLEALKRPEEALKAYRRSLEVRPRHLRTRHAYSVLLFNLGRMEDARQALEETTRLFPNDAASWLVLAGAYAHLGRLDTATDALGRAEGLGIDPRDRRMAKLIHDDIERRRRLRDR